MKTAEMGSALNMATCFLTSAIHLLQQHQQLSSQISQGELAGHAEPCTDAHVQVSQALAELTRVHHVMAADYMRRREWQTRAN